MLRKLVSRPLPDVPQSTPGLRAMAEDALAASPLAPARLFLDNLREFEDWWPVLVPLLLWVGWRTYQRERAEVLASRDTA